LFKNPHASQKGVNMPKKQKLKECKKPGLIVTFDDKDYTPEETGALWVELIETLFKLEKEAKQP